eukprot:gene284-510_t
MSLDFYKILQVSKTATLAEIKTSYRKLAFIFHPDRNNCNTAKASEFIQLVSAYDVLSDPIKRKEYDSRIGNHYSSSNRRVNKTYEKYATKTPYTPPAGDNHYDINVWNAWHYGDNAVAQSPLKQTNPWMNMHGNAHQAYNARQNARPYVRPQTSNNPHPNQQQPSQSNSNPTRDFKTKFEDVESIIKESKIRRDERQKYEEANAQTCCIKLRNEAFGLVNKFLHYDLFISPLTLAPCLYFRFLYTHNLYLAVFLHLLQQVMAFQLQLKHISKLWHFKMVGDIHFKSFSMTMSTCEDFSKSISS